MADSLARLYAEATEISNAAEAFYDLTEFDETSDFVTRVSYAQEILYKQLLESVPDVVVKAASGGAKSAELLMFRGNDLVEGFSTLFLLLGGNDHENRNRLEHYGFEPLIGKLYEALKPFHLEHRWDRTTNYNYLDIYWE